VIAKTTDRYGRTVGHVLIEGRDLNLAMLEEGMAWHYKKYDKNTRLAAAEKEAREARRGLWQDREPVPACRVPAAATCVKEHPGCVRRSFKVLGCRGSLREKLCCLLPGG
jgi:hypothetical protein